MAIEFTCPVCGAHGTVDNSRAGQDHPCRCGVVLVVPRESSLKPSSLTLSSARVEQQSPQPARPQVIPVTPFRSGPRKPLPTLCFIVFLLDALACGCYAFVCLYDAWVLEETPLHLYSIRAAAIVAAASVFLFGLIADLLLLGRSRFGVAFAVAALFVTTPAIIIAILWFAALLGEPASEISPAAWWRAMLGLALLVPVRIAFNVLYVRAVVKFVRWRHAEEAAAAR